MLEVSLARPTIGLAKLYDGCGRPHSAETSTTLHYITTTRHGKLSSLNRLAIYAIIE